MADIQDCHDTLNKANYKQVKEYVDAMDYLYDEGRLDTSLKHCKYLL